MEKILDLSGWRIDEVYELARTLARGVGVEYPYYFRSRTLVPGTANFRDWFSVRYAVLYLLDYVEEKGYQDALPPDDHWIWDVDGSGLTGFVTNNSNRGY